MNVDNSQFQLTLVAATTSGTVKNTNADKTLLSMETAGFAVTGLVNYWEMTRVVTDSLAATARILSINITPM